MFDAGWLSSFMHTSKLILHLLILISSAWLVSKQLDKADSRTQLDKNCFLLYAWLDAYVMAWGVLVAATLSSLVARALLFVCCHTCFATSLCLSTIASTGYVWCCLAFLLLSYLQAYPSSSASNLVGLTCSTKASTLGAEGRMGGLASIGDFLGITPPNKHISFEHLLLSRFVFVLYNGYKSCKHQLLTSDVNDHVETQLPKTVCSISVLMSML